MYILILRKRRFLCFNNSSSSMLIFPLRNATSYSNPISPGCTPADVYGSVSF